MTEREDWRAGYDAAVEEMRGVVARTGSPAANWAALYLASQREYVERRVLDSSETPPAAPKEKLDIYPRSTASATSGATKLGAHWTVPAAPVPEERSDEPIIDKIARGDLTLSEALTNPPAVREITFDPAPERNDEAPKSIGEAVGEALRKLLPPVAPVPEERSNEKPKKPPEWVLVRGVVYHRVVRFHGSRGREQRYYLRLSVPPDATPGKRSKWPVRYDEGRLPEHEVIDKERAAPIQKESVERLRSVMRSDSSLPVDGETT